MRKVWAGAAVALMTLGLGGAPAGAAGSTYTTTVTVKKNTLTAWYTAAHKAAVKGCATGDYAKAKVTVKHGITRARYDFSCSELATTTT